MARKQLEALRANCAEFGIELHATGTGSEGIVHVIGPELGLTQPGTTIVCGDSHTSTHGALGAFAVGIGTTEVEHVLATQTLAQQRPRTMLIEFAGELPYGLTPKDMILGAIGQVGVGGGRGHVVEYAGEAVRSLSIEGRLTICNMSIELGARAGMIGPDDTTFSFLEGRPRAPRGADWERALDHWRSLELRSRSNVRQARGRGRGRSRPAGDVGHQSGHGRPGDRRRARPRRLLRSRRPCRRVARTRVHGPPAGRAHRGHLHRPRLHRLVHELPDRGSPRGGRRHRRPEGRLGRDGARGPGLCEGSTPGGGGGPGPRSSSTRASSGASPAARCASR